MKAKTFDCVEMMHRGAEAVQIKIAAMTRDEELAFWKECSRSLVNRQASPQKDSKGEAAPPQ